MLQQRLSRLLEAMKSEKLDLVALLPGPNLRYLTGLSFHMMERPIVGLFPLDAQPHFVLPQLEADKARTAAMDSEIITYGEDLASRSEAFKRASDILDMNARCVGMELLRMRAFELQLLQEAAPRANIISGDAALAGLRVIKDQQELESMRRAVDIAQQALIATLPLVKLGMTERELASELVVQLLRAGSDPTLAFDPIVASGPNSALPHATPTDRRLQAKDALLIDWGARSEGYVSDLTRTFALSEPDPILVSIHALVLQANAASLRKARPGITCAEVDLAGRQVIADGGYGEAFIHRTGHGIGLEAHEHPYISSQNTQLLSPGMTFTIEPGIYLPGRCGVRIEDDVVAIEQGCESLSDMPRELKVIA
ncbi:MAG TPA: aminopeptidase P family protein [Anaerolineae bacterium]|nr:aminopeptidase P family protein [Anaerolineae bacterium]